MAYLYLILTYLGVIVSSYLIGSINWGFIISKYIYHIDIFKFGSGNAGGTNVGRACGKKAAYAVIILDVLKTIICIWAWFFIVSTSPLGKYFLTNISSSYPLSTFYYLAGIVVAIGHSFPIYTHFKGGKAVACYGGYALCTNFVMAILAFSIFLIVFFIKKRVSLASIIAASSALLITLVTGIIYIFRPEIASSFYYFNNAYRMDASLIHTAFTFFLTVLVLFLHKANIKRLKDHTEPETHYKHEEKAPSQE